MAAKKFIGSEADLCKVFIDSFNKQPGWTCYPETAGFDILVVHEDGLQIGVEAKLALNSKVAEQIVPDDYFDRYGKEGPDYRMVIVPSITEANAGIARMLKLLGVSVLKVRISDRMVKNATFTPPAEGEGGIGKWTEAVWEDVYSFDIDEWLTNYTYRNANFDWNPITRCEVPCVVPDVPAGVPAPVRLTPWKERALKVIWKMRDQGFITSKQIGEYGLSTSSWTQNGWLDKGAERGQWVESPRMPAFDKQHPDAYLKICELLNKQKAAHEAVQTV